MTPLGRAVVEAGYTLRKPSKYRAKPVRDGGRFFASRAEHKRYGELRLLDGAVNGITGLRCQPRFPLVVNGVNCGTYIPDFYYRDRGREICEDVKGFATPLFKLKAKLFRALHPTIELRITGKPSSVMSASPATATANRQSAGSNATSPTCSPKGSRRALQRRSSNR